MESTIRESTWYMYLKFFRIETDSGFLLQCLDDFNELIN